ncbi:HET-domain-containing protein [Xylariomycetidae sp. FL0641]|nr:HET-domain-containing protein [Xylariomycetidae sp. FL0641]
MWLINCITFKLEEFIQDAPPYAILSHTWGRDEVSFSDMRDHYQTQGKDGFNKIKTTCKIALSQGIGYAWVDTCCIDKSSSADLSEAINSMFSWYKQSTVCYVFLSDFEPHPSLELAETISRFEIREALELGSQYNDPPSLSGDEFHTKYQIQKSLGKARWFSRGWTLQELIAPEQVEFYDARGIFFGTKTILASILSWITGIDPNILRGDPLDSVLVGRRMSWAAGRQTTRLEDMAYCLLGLFDVNMPLLYGEGTKAFVRLQEAILQSSNDLSIFAWTAAREDQQPFRSIWARSPSEFKCCQALVKPSFTWADGGEYSIASQGLRTTGLVRVGRGDISQEGSYFLPLNCADARQTKYLRYIPLIQYGSGIFARRKPWRFVTASELEVFQGTKLDQPLYICSKDSPRLVDSVLTSFYGSLRIAFPPDIFDATTVIAWPSADWDLANSILLSCNRRRFWGVWKIRCRDREDGVSIVCVTSNGFLLYGIYSWGDLPAELERDVLLPSRIEEFLQSTHDRTSICLHGHIHSVDDEAWDLDARLNIPVTRLRIQSQKMGFLQRYRTKGNIRLARSYEALKSLHMA